LSILLVRHGRTAANARGLLLGRLDPDLDAEGVAQAAAVGATLAARAAAGHRRPPRVVASPLARARATAAAVAEAVGADDIELDERWLELDYGELDGVPLASVSPETWAAWRADADFCPPGGECLAALGRRVRSACEALAPAAADDDVIVVSHVSPIKAAVTWALGVGDLVAWRLYLAPGSITQIAITPGGPALHGYNELPSSPAAAGPPSA
jgi:broad specificity phosphatase PhoE